MKYQPYNHKYTITKLHPFYLHRIRNLRSCYAKICEGNRNYKLLTYIYFQIFNEKELFYVLYIALYFIMEFSWCFSYKLCNSPLQYRRKSALTCKVPTKNHLFAFFNNLSINSFLQYAKLFYNEVVFHKINRIKNVYIVEFQVCKFHFQHISVWCRLILQS